MATRISLKSMLAFVGFIAFGCAALLSADVVWNCIVGTLLMATLFIAVIYSIFERDARQAFALGYLAISSLYLGFMAGEELLRSYVEKADRVVTFGDAGTEALPTSVILKQLHATIVHKEYHDPITETDKWGTRQFRPYLELPRKDLFMIIGHRLCAIFLGLCGAQLARIVYCSRIRRQSTQSDRATSPITT